MRMDFFHVLTLLHHNRLILLMRSSALLSHLPYLPCDNRPESPLFFAAPTGGVGGITKAVILETVLERMVHLEKQYIEYKALKEKIASLRARKHSLKVSDIFTLDENSPAGLLDQPLVIPPLPNSNSGNAGLDENVQMHQSPGQSTIEATMSPIPSAADFNRQTMNFAMHLHEPKQEQYGSQENLGQEGTILQQIKTIGK